MTTTPASTGEMDHLDQLGAQAAGLETSGGDTLRVTSNRPWLPPLKPPTSSQGLDLLLDPLGPCLPIKRSGGHSKNNGFCGFF